MPLSNASRLADFGTGIGTAGAVLKVDNPNQRVGIGTTAPTATLGVAGIVSATAFYGDGSNLDGVASAGLGTALSDSETSPLSVIYQTSDTLSVGATITVDPPDATTKVAYTQYADILLENDADLIVADGDDFIPDILGLSTEGFSFSDATGNGVFGTVYADNIENAAGRGGPNFPLGITVSGISTLSGNVSIGGTLTYEDVTNVDSVGLITARSGVVDSTLTSGRILIAGASGRLTDNNNLKFDGNQLDIDSSAQNNLKINSTHSDGPNIFLERNGSAFAYLGSAAANISGGTATDFAIRAQGSLLLTSNGGNERLRIGTAGQIGIAGANYGTSGQVLTSQGSAAAPQWATPSGGLSVADFFGHSGGALVQNTDLYFDGINYTKTNSASSSVMTVTGGSSEGVFTFPSTGMYRIDYSAYVNIFSGGYYRLRCFGSRDNASSWTENVIYTENLEDTNNANSYKDYTNHYAFFNVTNTTNDKVKFGVIVPSDQGSVDGIKIIFMKLN